MKQIIHDVIASEDDRDKTIAEMDQLNLLAFTIAGGRSLRVTSTEEAMDLLLYSNRVDHDIGMRKLFLGEENFTMNLVLRRWEDISFQYEFRCLFLFN
jgi:hypothetical protein